MKEDYQNIEDSAPYQLTQQDTFIWIFKLLYKVWRSVPIRNKKKKFKMKRMKQRDLYHLTNWVHMRKLVKC